VSATSESPAPAPFTIVAHAPAPWSVVGARRLGAGLSCSIPALLTLYLSFNSGGYFAASQGVVLAALAACVAIRVLVVRAPFAGFTRSSLIMLGALAVYALWSLASSDWSHAPARALLGFSLTAVYLLAAALSVSVNRSERRVRWTLGLTWAAMLIVCVASLATRLRPDLFPTPAGISVNRLAFPLTYWNALGLFATIGLVLTMNLASSARGPVALRIFATATAPVFAVTMLLTFSRATVLLGAFSLLAYLIMARSPGLIGALIAAVPASAAALITTYHAKLIANADTSPAAVIEGRHLVVVIGLTCLAAAALRLALIGLDERRLPLAISRRSRRAFVLGAVALVAVFGVAFSGRIASSVHTFLKSDTTSGTNDVRNRLGSIRIGGRLEGWRVALHMYDRDPLRGAGANTFALYWQRKSSSGGTALQTHSLYLQALSELGIPGLLAMFAALVVLLGGLWVRRRRASRSLWSALFLVGLLWAVHAGVDWDWQMPALTLPVIALAAAGLSRRGRPRTLSFRAETILRAGVAVVAVVLAIVGLHVATSDARLNAAVIDFNRGDCAAAAADSAASLSALPSRPQPYEIEGYCDVLTGKSSAALSAMQAAVVRDPGEWRYHYGLAVSQAAAGLSAKAELRTAATLDPSESDITAAAKALAVKTSARRKAAARLLTMPVSMGE
jgi:hypothetical protein